MSDNRLSRVTERAFLRVLAKCDGNLSAVAKAVGVSRTTVNRWVSRSDGLKRAVALARLEPKRRELRAMQAFVNVAHEKAELYEGLAERMLKDLPDLSHEGVRNLEALQVKAQQAKRQWLALEEQLRIATARLGQAANDTTPNE